MATPSDFRTFANFETSACSSRYVNVRTSPGSPSQISAGLSPRVARCRSRQLDEALSFPPTNHFAYGGFHSSTVSHFVCQSSCSAHAAQIRLAVGDVVHRLGSFALALRRKSSDGGKLRGFLQQGVDLVRHGARILAIVGVVATFAVGEDPSAAYKAASRAPSL